MIRVKSLLHNRHVGESVVLIANGPSLNITDMSLLKGKTIIGLNKIFLGFRDYQIYPKYYVAINKYVIGQSLEEIKHLNCVKFIGNNGQNRQLENDALTYILNTETPPSRFCKDISRGVNEGWTVTYAALQVAFYLGFSRVLIIGLDHRFSYAGEENELQTMSGADCNHFSTEYFGAGQEWQTPDIKHSEESFHIAKQIYEKDGREIIDLTVNGECNVFRKADFKDYMNNWS